MSLESVTYVGDLVTTNPDSSLDVVRYGADHLRNIKKALRNCFAGFGGAIMVTGTDVGAANTYAINPSQPVPAYVSGMQVWLKPANASTGAATINISGLGAISIVRLDGTALVNGDLVTTETYGMSYDAANNRFVLLGVTKNYVDQLAFAAIPLPAQSGNSGKFLQTDGTNASWQLALPSQSGNSGLFLTTNGTTASWSNPIATQTGNSGKILTTDGSTSSWASRNLPIAAAGGAVDAITATITGVSTVDQQIIAVVSAGANATPTPTLKLNSDTAHTITTKGGAALAAGNIGAAGYVGIYEYNSANTRWELLNPINNQLVLLSTLTPTAAANVDALTVFSSSYDHYMVTIEGIKPAADDALRLRFANAGTADSGSVYYGSAGAESGTGVTSAATAAVMSGTVTTAGIGYNGVFFVSNVNDAVNLKSVAGKAQMQSAATPGYINGGYQATYNAANAISGIRLYWTGGSNFAAQGKIRIYGIAQ